MALPAIAAASGLRPTPIRQAASRQRGCQASGSSVTARCRIRSASEWRPTCISDRAWASVARVMLVPISSPIR